MIRVRKVESKDLNEIKSWYLKRGIVFDTSYLPKFGLIADGICAGFLYRTDSTLAVVGNLVSDPDSDRETRSQALDLLIEMLYSRARFEGFKRVTAASNLNSVKKRLVSLGFTPGDEKVDHFYKE